MAVQISGNDITVPRDGSFTRNVTIGGTLTYEDVTNIDSVGLVTARSGIEIGARPGVAASISVDGNMIVSGISTFGGDVQVPDKIIHAGDTNTALRFPAADTITAETGGSERLRITSDGKIGINETSPGQRLTVGGDIQIGFNTPNDAARQINFNVNRGSAADTLANINWQWNDKYVAQIRGIAGADTTNKDDGHLAFFTSAANNLVERLRITSAGYVGINQSSPGTGLHVSQDWVASYGSISAEGSANALVGMGLRSNGSYEAALIWRDGSSGDYLELATQNSNPILFKTANTERLRIDGSNLRFAVTNAQIELQTSDGSDNGFLNLSGGGACSQGRGAQVVCYGNDYTDYQGTLMLLAGQSGNTNGVIQFYTSGSEVARIASNGSVNIGDNFGQTTYKTQIEATDQNVLRLVTDSDNADGVELVLRKDSASPADEDNIGNIYFQGNDDGGNATFYASMEAYSDDVSNGSENGYIRFRTRNDGTMAERLRIGSDGTVTLTSHLILGNSDEIKLGSSSQMTIWHTGSDFTMYNNAGNLVIANASGTGTGEGAIVFKSGNNNTRWTITSGGDFIPASNNSFTVGSSSNRVAVFYSNTSLNTSDRNEKNTITDSDLGLSFINKLRPVSYKWNQKEGEILDTKTHYGLIAQDIEETVLTEGKEITDFGFIDKPKEGQMSLAYSELISPLIKAVQELSAEVAALKSQLNN